MLLSLPGAGGSVFPIFFFNDTATTEIYTLSLHDALPIYGVLDERGAFFETGYEVALLIVGVLHLAHARDQHRRLRPDRKSTRLNSSHANISYAVFCLKKKRITCDALRPAVIVLMERDSEA